MAPPSLIALYSYVLAIGMPRRHIAQTERINSDLVI
jgi:hypothetical protein